MKLQGGTVPATGVGSTSPIRMKHYETEEGRTGVCVCVCVCVRASMCMCVSKGGYEGELAGPCTRQRKEGHAVCVRVRTCIHLGLVFFVAQLVKNPPAMWEIWV